MLCCCRAFAHVSATRECALYFAEGYGITPANGVMQKRKLSDSSSPGAFCVRRDRGLATDRHVRIGLGQGWATAKVSHLVPPATASEVSALFFLRACTKLVLGCAGAECQPDDLNKALQTETRSVKNTTLIKSSGASSDAAYLNFGCVTSGTCDP